MLYLKKLESAESGFKTIVEKLNNLKNSSTLPVEERYIGDYEVQIIGAVLGLFGYTLEDPVMTYGLCGDCSHAPTYLKATIKLYYE